MSNGTLTLQLVDANGNVLGTTGNPLNQTLSEVLAGAFADGAIVTLGTEADTAQTDPTQSATLIALAKGILQESQSSANNFSLPLSLTNADLAVTIPFKSRKILVANDGGDNINFALGGTASYGSQYLYTASAWTFSGTWTVTNAVPNYPAEYADATNTANTAKCVPGVAGSSSITLGYLIGINGAVVSVQLSSDGGATWANPSTFSGLTRSDGATGSALDTISQSSSTTTYMTITYQLPYDAALTWAISIAPVSGATGGTDIFIRDAYFDQAQIFAVKPSEDLELDVAVQQINLSSPTSTTGRLMVI